MDYKIKKISEVNTVGLHQFFKLAFPSRYISLKRHWKWYYKIDGSNYEPLVLEYNSKIIGMAGLLPETLSFNNLNHDAVWFTDFYVLKEYRDKGFGSILVAEWMKMCEIQITYCNDISLKIFKKFDWKSNHKIYRKINPVNVLNLIPVVNRFNLDFKILK